MTARRLALYGWTFLAGYTAAWLATMLYLRAPLAVSLRYWWPW